MSTQTTDEPIVAEHETGATFALDENDPRRTDNRGGLAATFPTPEGASASAQPQTNEQNDSSLGANDLSTTGADTSSPSSSANHDTGTSSTGNASNGQVNMTTTGIVAPRDAPPGAGPVEGSQSGAKAPQVEITDLGPMDVNTTAVSELAQPTDS